MAKNFGTFFHCLTLLCLAPIAEAAQLARVNVDKLSVLAEPSLEAPAIGAFTKNQRIYVSSGAIRGALPGQAWYKTRLPESTGYGFVSASEVVTENYERSLERQGVDLDNRVEGIDLNDKSWSFALRLMGLVGYGAQQPNKGSVFGGEGELSYAIPLAEDGYLHRAFAFGPALMRIEDRSITALSLIYRVFAETTAVEPEVRIRLGREPEGYVYGIIAGARFPFTTATRAGLSAYAESGLITTSEGKSAHAWGSAGLGFHF